MSFGNVLGQQTDLSQYATKSEVDSKINNAATNYMQQELIGSWNGINASTGVSVDYDFTHRLPIAFKVALKCGQKSSSNPKIIYMRTGNNAQIEVFNVPKTYANLQLSCFFPIIYYNYNYNQNKINAGIIVYNNGIYIGAFNFLTNETTKITIDSQDDLDNKSNISLYAIY